MILYAHVLSHAATRTYSRIILHTLFLSFLSFDNCTVLQASEDAKKLVDEERAFARAEIENARAAVQRVEEALQEHERMSRALGKQVLLQFFCLHSYSRELLIWSCCFCYQTGFS